MVYLGFEPGAADETTEQWQLPNFDGVRPENTLHWGKYHCTARQQFTKTGFDQQRKYVLGRLDSRVVFTLDF